MLFNLFEQKKTNFLIYDNRPPYAPLFLVTQLIESENKPMAAFLIAFSIGKDLQTILEPLSLPFSLKFGLLTADKVVFYASDPKLRFQLFKPLSPERRQALIASQIYGGFQLAENPVKTTKIPNSPFFEFTFGGKKQIGYMIDIPDSAFSFLAYTSMSEIISGVLKRFTALFATYIGILLLGSAIVFFLTRRMAKPFLKLFTSIQEVKNHDLSARYQPDRFGFEINYLGQAFNDMLDSVQAYMHQAEEERAKREAVAQELRIGREVQKQLLPQKMPDYPNVEIADFYIFAKEVGGDFYDVFIQETGGERKLFLTIADTSGKGISACLYSLGVRSLLRSFGKEIKELSKIVQLTNKNFYEDAGDSGMFVTAFVGTYDNRSRQLTYFSCGHNPGIIKRKEGEIEILKNHGPALGFQEFIELVEKKVEIRSGDMLILYTDGITEAHNEKNELFGMERLVSFLQEQKDVSAKELADGLIGRIQEFTSKVPQHDDMTLLVLKIVEGS